MSLTNVSSSSTEELTIRDGLTGLTYSLLADVGRQEKEKQNSKLRNRFCVINSSIIMIRIADTKHIYDGTWNNRGFLY